MVYLIIRLDFDNLENSTALAEYSTFLGYKITEKEALEYIKEQETNIKKYKSWDNDIYPKYKIKKVEEIK